MFKLICYLYLAVNLGFPVRAQSRLKYTISHHMLTVTHFNPAPIKCLQIAFPDLKAWRGRCCHGSHVTSVPRWRGGEREWAKQVKGECLHAIATMPATTAPPSRWCVWRTSLGEGATSGALNQHWREVSQENVWELLHFQNDQTGNATSGLQRLKMPFDIMQGIRQISLSFSFSFSLSLTLSQCQWEVDYLTHSLHVNG